MPTFVVYAVWTSHEVIAAANYDEALDRALAECAVSRSVDLSLCNWHAVEVPEPVLSTSPAGEEPKS